MGKFVIDAFLEKEWKRYLRNGKHLSFILIDIDFSKPYNVTHAYKVGDDYLKMCLLL